VGRGVVVMVQVAMAVLAMVMTVVVRVVTCHRLRRLGAGRRLREGDRGEA